jgi:tRNA (cmo5U34)-methyltransferase
MNEFDTKAQDWDKNTMNHDRALAIASQLKERIAFAPGMKAMEFGAGTALLSFILRDSFSSITLIDNSQEMIRVCNEKIAETQFDHIHALQLDLENDPYDENFDLIYSQMAFHHLSDIDKVIQKLYRLLNKNGSLAIADLYSEDGSFHGDGFLGHKGFDPEWLASIMQNTGFINVFQKPCFMQKKVDTDGTYKEYPVFLIIASKI